jgi:polysaccharide pyruvyl transferase WcaK-like protein
MKNDHPVITLLGNNSGNNIGDAAIMASVMDMLTEVLPTAEFLVPSMKPEWIETHYGKKYNVRAIDVRPRTGSLRLFGIPTFQCLAKSDAALICDGIIFDHKLFSPHNFLSTLYMLLPALLVTRCKLVCFSTGIGPLRTGLGRHMAKCVINACDLVMMRDEDSRTLCREIGVTKEVHLTGDAAFVNKVSPDERAPHIAAELGLSLEKPLFGVNVTSYMDSWLVGKERLSDPKGYLRLLAESIQGANATLGNPFTPLVFSTHPMDEPPADELAQLLSTNGSRCTVIKNSTYSSHDEQALMRRCGVFLGMRFHSLILSSAVQAPIIALIYAPKVRGYMRLLKSEDVALELGSLTKEKLQNTIIETWKNREQIGARQKVPIDELKRRAYIAARLLRERIYPRMHASEGVSIPTDASTLSGVQAA